MNIVKREDFQSGLIIYFIFILILLTLSFIKFILKNVNNKKVVIVTGASSGIGLSLCKLLVCKGYKVYGLSRRKVDENFESLQCDVTNEELVKQCFNYIFEKEGQIDVLVNNAGMGISGAVEYIETDQNKKLFDVNVNAAITLSKLVISYMKNCGGKIVNISSIAGIIPIPFQTAYSMSKAAINYFTMCLKMELAPLNIQVCAVMPGDTKTGFTGSREKESTSEGYGGRIEKSVSRMEKDEKNGVPPEKVAKVIFKQIKRKHPPVLVSVGAKYKLFVFLQKILPRSLMLKIVKMIYG